MRLRLRLRKASETALETRRSQSPPQNGAHVEILGLDGQGLLESKDVLGVQHEVEVLQQHSHDEQRLLPRKGSSNAATHPIAEGLPRIGELFASFLKLGIQHALRDELVGIVTVDVGVEVRLGEEIDNSFALAYRVLAGEKGILVGLDGEIRNGGIESKGFAENGRDVGQLGQLVDLDGALADDLVNFVLCLAVLFRVLQELVKGEGEETRSRLVASNQERDEVVHDALVRHVLASLGVNALEHGSKQVTAVTLGGFARLEDFFGCCPQDVDVLLKLVIPGPIDDGGQRKSARLFATFDEEVAHGLNEGMEDWRVEAVEPEPH